MLPRVRGAKNDWMRCRNRALVRARPVPLGLGGADTRADPSGARASHGEALDAFIARKREIDAMLQRLTDLCADHFGVDPEDVDWGHVGTLGHYAQRLRQVSDSEGEYAA